MNTQKLIKKNVQENCIYAQLYKLKRRHIEYSSCLQQEEKTYLFIHALAHKQKNDTQAHVKVIIVHNSRIPHFVLFLRY